MKIYNVIGLMSGTSLDGLDIAYIQFWHQNNHWNYKIKEAITLKYSEIWKNKLVNAPNLTGEKLTQLDIEYGHYLGKSTSNFINKIKEPIDLVASHGHTIFHNPKAGYTLQIGNGNALVSHLNCQVIYDFRPLDIALGGQGAPLVPIGDQLLFSEYDGCLNLGGFANISIRETKTAWDICPFNIVLNALSQRVEMDFDEGGFLASQGEINHELLKNLEGLNYYKKQQPKSLGREWVEKEIMPLLNSFDNTSNLLRTIAEHFALRLSCDLATINGRIIVTGGGAKNNFILDRLKQLTKSEIIIPQDVLIDYKEALIFGLMGLLRHLQLPNINGKITGSKQNIISGSIVLPPIAVHK
jgi:anhydro-N-acetylmuramic acid kinase